MFYDNMNELKFFGDFDLFHGGKKIKKLKDKTTTSFNQDFILKDI